MATPAVQYKIKAIAAQLLWQHPQRKVVWVLGARIGLFPVVVVFVFQVFHIL
jgi:hypothetical protein